MRSFFGAFGLMAVFISGCQIAFGLPLADLSNQRPPKEEALSNQGTATLVCLKPSFQDTSEDGNHATPQGTRVLRIGSPRRDTSDYPIMWQHVRITSGPWKGSTGWVNEKSIHSIDWMNRQLDTALSENEYGNLSWDYDAVISSKGRPTLLSSKPSMVQSMDSGKSRVSLGVGTPVKITRYETDESINSLIWFQVKVMAGEFKGSTGYVSSGALILDDARGLDYIVPIVFPDYQVGTPIGKMSYLGHAAVLIIKSGTGDAVFAEYGRYDKKEQLGIVRRYPMGKIELQGNGKPELNSLVSAVTIISNKYYKGTRVVAVVARGRSAFAAANRYVNERYAENKNPKRTPYSITTNNCMHFVRNVMREAELRTPVMIDPRPYSYIHELMEIYPPVK